MKFVFLLTFVLTELTLVIGWSRDAHRLIADIAAHHLSDLARDEYFNILGLDKWSKLRQWLVDASDWADHYMTDGGFAESSAYHYVHTTPTCEVYDHLRDCGDASNPGVCLVSGISYHIDVALDTAEASESQIASIKHLVHYMADIHQPLHVGFRGDFGGNTFFVKGFNGAALETFHSVWDGRLLWHKTHVLGKPNPRTLLDYFKRISYGEYTRLTNPIRGVDLTNSTDVSAMLSSLVTETARDITCKIYTNMENPSKPIISGETLSDTYKRSAGDIVFNQMRKAGLRLASLLNSIAYYRSQALIADDGI